MLVMLCPSLQSLPVMWPGGVACMMASAGHNDASNFVLSMMNHIVSSNLLSKDEQAKAEQTMLDMGAARLLGAMLRPEYVEGEEAEANLGLSHAEL